MVPALCAVRAASAAAAHRHPSVRLRGVIFIELNSYLRYFRSGHDSPIGRRREV
jgi:hypothetical protein